MQAAQLRMWPAQERVLSPVPACLFGTAGAFAALGVLTMRPALVAAALGFLGTLMSWGSFFSTGWIARLDKRYGASNLLFRRLTRRTRSRAAVRLLLRPVEAASRVTLACLIVVLVALLVYGIAGVAPRAKDSSVAMEPFRTLVQLLSMAAVGTTCTSMFLRRAVSDWDQAAVSSLCLSPVLSSAELAQRLEHEAAVTTGRLLMLAAFVVGAVAAVA